MRFQSRQQHSSSCTLSCSIINPTIVAFIGATIALVFSPQPTQFMSQVYHNRKLLDPKQYFNLLRGLLHNIKINCFKFYQACWNAGFQYCSKSLGSTCSSSKVSGSQPETSAKKQSEKKIGRTHRRNRHGIEFQTPPRRPV